MFQKISLQKGKQYIEVPAMEKEKKEKKLVFLVWLIRKHNEKI